MVCNQWRIYIVKFWTRAPPGGPNSFNFMQFLGNFGKIVCWRPPLGSWRPLLGEILDPPLVTLFTCHYAVEGKISQPLIRRPLRQNMECR